MSRTQKKTLFPTTEERKTPVAPFWKKVQIWHGRDTAIKYGRQRLMHAHVYQPGWSCSLSSFGLGKIIIKGSSEERINDLLTRVSRSSSPFVVKPIQMTYSCVVISRFNCDGLLHLFLYLFFVWAPLRVNFVSACRLKKRGLPLVTRTPSPSSKHTDQGETDEGAAQEYRRNNLPMVLELAGLVFLVYDQLDFALSGSRALTACRRSGMNFNKCD